MLVGEMRDLETVAIAIETAETGHLVFGTLHTTTAASTVDRIIDQFPADRQAQIRVMLSESLKGVIAQTLCKKIGGGRRRGARGADRHAGDQQPDPRGEDVPDPVDDAGRQGRRHGDAERRAARAREEQARRARGGLREGRRQAGARDDAEAGRVRPAETGRGPGGPAGRRHAAGPCRSSSR